MSSSEGKPGKRPINGDSAEAFPAAKRGHWSLGLLNTMKDPKMVLYDDDLMVIIKDMYPKARCHLLALPKENIPTLSKVTNDKIKLLEHIEIKAKEYIENFHKGTEVRYGYHAIPSMAQVHMHVISQDFDSPCLKNKKHWNSFNSSYFIDSSDILKELKQTGKLKLISASEGKKYLDTPLKCHKCGLALSNIPKLKQHIITHIKS